MKRLMNLMMGEEKEPDEPVKLNELNLLFLSMVRNSMKHVFEERPF
jgi:hypothetical protein